MLTSEELAMIESVSGLSNAFRQTTSKPIAGLLDALVVTVRKYVAECERLRCCGNCEQYYHDARTGDYVCGHTEDFADGSATRNCWEEVLNADTD